MKITEDIKYVGVDDHDIDLFEGQYVVPRGMAYNSYLVKDAKTLVFDTVDARFGEKWLANIRAEIGDAPVKAASPFTYDGAALTTPWAVLTFDENGYIASLIERSTGRELRKKDGEPLNVLLFSEDVPLSYDNWDVERDAIQKGRPVKGFLGRELITNGAVEIRLRSRYNVGDGTTLTQDLVCYADTPRIDFHTLVDGKSHHRLLKAGFDLDIAATRARCEIQYGVIERPTTENTGLEVAKFEVTNRNYTDISEPRFGAALLNDCKYGVALAGCNLRLSLHRGGDHPTVTGDDGVHELTYALYPHAGSFSAENAAYPAYQLNVPTVCVKGAAEIPPIAEVSAANVIVEAVKPAEDGSDAFVLRMYECEGARANARVKLGVPVKSAVLTNLLEDEKEALPLEDNSLSLSFTPFEIKTVKLARR